MARVALLVAFLVGTGIAGCSDPENNEVSFHGGGGGTQTGSIECPEGAVDLGVAIKGESGSILVTIDAPAGLGGTKLHEERTYRPTFAEQTASEHFSGFDGEFRVTFSVVRSEDWQGRYTVTLAC